MFQARRDAKLLEAVTIKADLQAKSDRLHQAINQRAADEAAAAAADVIRNEIYILINHTNFDKFCRLLQRLNARRVASSALGA
jgi:hypothetical protein